MIWYMKWKWVWNYDMIYGIYEMTIWYMNDDIMHEMENVKFQMINMIFGPQNDEM